MRRPALLAPLALAVALAACSVGSEQQAAKDDVAGENAVDLTPEGPGLGAQLFGGGKPMPLTVQVTSPGGMVLQLTSIQAKPTETVVGVIAINGDDDEQKLNAWPNNKQAYIITSSGERLYLSPPQANPELQVGAGQRMEGQLVFLGRLPQGGGGTLILNDGDINTNQYDNSPGFRIPLPLKAAAWSDDGSKKKSAA